MAFKRARGSLGGLWLAVVLAACCSLAEMSKHFVDTCFSRWLSWHKVREAYIVLRYHFTTKVSCDFKFVCSSLMLWPSCESCFGCQTADVGLPQMAASGCLPCQQTLAAQRRTMPCHVCHALRRNWCKQKQVLQWKEKEQNIPSRELTYPWYQGTSEDDFPFPKVGYVSSLESRLANCHLQLKDLKYWKN